MPTYIRLTGLTDQAVKNVGSLGVMLLEARKVREANHCRLVQAWSTFGAYDTVTAIEGPDDATAMKASALISQQGNFRAHTLPDVPIQGFINLVK